jgi:hypothetical protein
LRYTINLVPDASVEAVGWDGFAELWFEDERTMEAAIASEAGVRLAEDSATTFSTASPWSSRKRSSILRQTVSNRAGEHLLGRCPVDIVKAGVVAGGIRIAMGHQPVVFGT